MNGATFFHLLLQASARTARRRVLAVREQSWLMVAVVALFVAAYWVGGYFLFRFAFRFLTTSVPGLGLLLLDRMLYLFFAFLFLMLLFSNVIIGYSALFKSQETQWMLTLPVPAANVFRWKAAETTVLASWAFLFLTGPLMLAYGVVRGVAPLFYAKVLLLFIPFIVIPASLGSLLVLVAARYLDRRTFKYGLFGLAGVAVAVAVLLLRPAQAVEASNAQMADTLNQLLRHSRITLQPLLPSYWVTSGLIAWGGAGAKGGFFFLVLLSNALMGALVCDTASARLFYEGWSRNHSQGFLPARGSWFGFKPGTMRVSVLDWLLDRLPLSPGTRALIAKDARVFWRDTSQWSQFVIFFGLLGLYVMNLRHASGDTNSESWAMFISFLNLGAASMTLATLTTRFVFPQFSLEGKRLWIVGMAPYGLKRVLLVKFWVSSTLAVAITLPLMTISSWMLRVPAWLCVLFDATVVLMSFALCALAVGIGALFPNFGSGSTANRRDDNPSKIVSGFGGTFCFVLSLVYIITVVGAEAGALLSRLAGGVGVGDDNQMLLMVGVWLFVALVSLVAITVPLSLALKRIESLEL